MGWRASRWHWNALFLACLAVFQIQHCRAGSPVYLLDVTDDVEVRDLELGGQCESGCVRRVASAVARSAGEVDCDLRVQNLLDHTEEDVAGGALNVVHSCTDAEGNLMYQVGQREKGRRGDGKRVENARRNYDVCYKQYDVVSLVRMHAMRTLFVLYTLHRVEF